MNVSAEACTGYVTSAVSPPGFLHCQTGVTTLATQDCCERGLCEPETSHTTQSRRCSPAPGTAMLGYLVNLLLSPALSTGPHTQYVPCTWPSPRGARESSPYLLPFTKPVLQFSYLHHDKTWSLKLGAHPSLPDPASPHSNIRSGWQGAPPCPWTSAAHARFRVPDHWEFIICGHSIYTKETATINPPRIL